MIEAKDSNKNHKIEFDEFYDFAISNKETNQHNLNSISEYWLQYSTKPIIREVGMWEGWRKRRWRKRRMT